MKRSIYTLLVLLLAFASTEAKEYKTFLAAVTYGNSVSEEVTDHKVDAALHIALELTNKYKHIPLRQVDSVIHFFREKNERDPKAYEIAKELKADRMVFVHVNQLKNMLRVDLVLQPSKGKKKYKGMGYDLLHFHHITDGRALYDPTLLTALQRAFADAINKKNLYADAKGSLKVFPAETMVIGGLMFADNSEYKDWDLFIKQEIVSYDAVESIFEVAINHPKYAVYDVDSRDSIFAIYNMFGIENHKAPTRNELNALKEMGVKKYVTGLFKRTKEGAEVELHYCDISTGFIVIKKSEKAKLDKDNLLELRKVVKAVTRKLLGIKEEEPAPEEKPEIESKEEKDTLK